MFQRFLFSEISLPHNWCLEGKQAEGGNGQRGGGLLNRGFGLEITALSGGGPVNLRMCVCVNRELLLEQA